MQLLTANCEHRRVPPFASKVNSPSSEGDLRHDEVLGFMQSAAPLWKERDGL